MRPSRTLRKVENPPPNRVSNAESDGSTPWLSFHSRWEQDGQWQNLIDWYEHHESHSTRWMAAALRAYAFTANEIQFASIDKKLSALFRAQSQATEACAVWHLAHSCVLRRDRQWAQAKTRALKASAIAKKYGFTHLKFDAEFAIAICLDEQGRFYRALDLYQQIARDERASPFRRGLAALNEAWSLWDLGRAEAISALQDLIPEKFQPRIQLMQALHRLDNETILRNLTLDTSQIPHSELCFIAQLLLEWMFLNRSLVPESLTHSWLPSFAKTVDTPEIRNAWESWQSKTPIQSTELSGQWRADIDNEFMRMLSWIDCDLETALGIYQNSIDAQLARQGLETALVPRFASLTQKESPWAKRLAARLFPDSISETKLRLLSDKIEVVTAGKVSALGIEKSPKTVLLLEILEGPRGKTVSKRELHERLTGTRYASHLHDDRIYKLLKRLNQKIETSLGAKIVEWSGDNQIKVLHRIEVNKSIPQSKGD